MCVNDLPRVATQQRGGWELNPRLVDCKSSTLTVTLLSHVTIRFKINPWSSHWAEGTCRDISGTKLRRVRLGTAGTLEAAEITSLCHEQRTAWLNSSVLLYGSDESRLAKLQTWMMSSARSATGVWWRTHLVCLFAWGLTALSAQIGYIAP